MPPKYELTCPQQDKLTFAELVAEDGLSIPFKYTLDLVSDKPEIKLEELLGETLTFSMPRSEGRRFFNGVILDLQLVGESGDNWLYRVTVGPWFSLLKNFSDCKIFQEKSVPDIFKEVCSALNFSDIKDSLSMSYAPRHYCVQYRESTFDFLSRLLEEEGIYYYFEHRDGAHDLVLADSISAHDQLNHPTVPLQRAGASSAGVEHLWSWTPSKRICIGKHEHTDYDFERPGTDLMSVGAEDAGHVHSDGTVYDYPGLFLAADEGERLARMRSESYFADHERYRAEGNARELAAGSLFTLTNSFRASENREYLITRARLVIKARRAEEDEDSSEEGRAIKFVFDCIPSKVQYRSPRVTPKPFVRGPHTAEVVGPRGEEIYTDKYGRVKVQFHWDREGKLDENTTCWMRVAQMWAGKQWGGIFIPRIGQEVIVDFLEGDPDRPVVTGSLYNGSHLPPYELPANLTQSGIKTRSTKKGTDENFNELRFEDKMGSEEIYFHAEKDFNRVVENSDTLKVGFDKKDPGNQAIDIYNDRTVTLDQGNDKLTVKKGNREDTISEGNDTLTVSKGKRTTTIEGNDTLTINSGNQTIKVSKGKIAIEAAQEIKLTVGGSSITISPASVAIASPKVEVSGDATVKVGGALIEVAAGGALTLKGAVVKIN